MVRAECSRIASKRKVDAVLDLEGDANGFGELAHCLNLANSVMHVLTHTLTIIRTRFEYSQVREKDTHTEREREREAEAVPGEECLQQ
jgi:hypothetical protein